MKRALAIAVVFLTVGSVVASFFTEAERGVVVLHVALTAMFASWTVLGLIVTIRQPDNRVGWLLIATGIFGATFIFSEQVALFVSYGESSLTAAQNAVAFAGLNFTFTFACLALLFLVFPTGHLLSQRWRWAVWFVGATAVIAAVGIYPVSRSVVDVEQFLLNNWSPEFAAFTPTISATLDIINLTTRYRQILWMGSGGQAASFDPWVLLSTRFPSLNSMPAWTRATSSGLLTFRHRSWAASSSL